MISHLDLELLFPQLNLRDWPLSAQRLRLTLGERKAHGPWTGRASNPFSLPKTYECLKTSLAALDIETTINVPCETRAIDLFFLFLFPRTSLTRRLHSRRSYRYSYTFARIHSLFRLSASRALSRQSPIGMQRPECGSRVLAAGCRGEIGFDADWSRKGRALCWVERYKHNDFPVV